MSEHEQPGDDRHDQQRGYRTGEAVSPYLVPPRTVVGIVVVGVLLGTVLLLAGSDVGLVVLGATVIIGAFLGVALVMARRAGIRDGYWPPEKGRGPRRGSDV